MSAVHRDGTRAELPREHSAMLSFLKAEYARNHPLKMRRLQILQLVAEGWTTGEIARAWGYKHHGPISAQLAIVRQELAAAFSPPAE